MVTRSSSSSWPAWRPMSLRRRLLVNGTIFAAIAIYMIAQTLVQSHRADLDVRIPPSDCHCQYKPGTNEPAP